MVNIKSFIVAALLSGVAAASFAQAPAAPKAAGKPTTTALTAPADAASTPKAKKVKKHTGAKHKKAAASAAK